jgi:hypothetical protein
MPEPDLQKLLAAAQSRVGGARALLARPRACNVEECAALFCEAQGYLESVRDSLAHAGPASRYLRRQAAILDGEIRQAGVLLEQAARCGRRWLKGMRRIAPEYTASGAAVPLRISGQISLLG